MRARFTQIRVYVMMHETVGLYSLSLCQIKSDIGNHIYCMIRDTVINPLCCLLFLYCIVLQNAKATGIQKRTNYNNNSLYVSTKITSVSLVKKNLGWVIHVKFIVNDNFITGTEPYVM